MRERDIERQLVEAVKKRGGICAKWYCPSMVGMPDRLVFLPGRKFGMVEVKAPGEKLRNNQLMRQRRFGRLGFTVFVVDSKEKIEPVLNLIMGGEGR